MCNVLRVSPANPRLETYLNRDCGGISPPEVVILRRALILHKEHPQFVPVKLTRRLVHIHGDDWQTRWNLRGGELVVEGLAFRSSKLLLVWLLLPLLGSSPFASGLVYCTVYQWACLSELAACAGYERERARNRVYVASPPWHALCRCTITKHTRYRNVVCLLKEDDIT